MDLSALTMREFYSRYFKPHFLVRAKPKTFAAYGESLDHWDRETDRPSLASIDTLTLACFKSALADDDRKRTCSPLSSATVNKHIRHVQAVLNKAGPPGRGNRDALGIIAVAPWTKPLREDDRIPRVIREDHLAAIYAACDVAVHPAIAGVSPVDWWRALIVLAYNVASRRGAILRLQQSSVDWHLHQVLLPADDDKRRKDRLKPLNTTVIRHLMKIRRSDGELFPWPMSESTFYRQWHLINDASGLAECDHYVPHDLKRTCVSTMLDVADTFVVQKMADHASIKTTELYVNRANKLRPATEAMPQPWPEKQLELFGTR